MASNAPLIYSFARWIDSSREYPFARLDAIALDKVQPVPWVFGLLILFPWNHVASPSWYRRSFASFKLCPPLHKTAQCYSSWIFFAASTISSSDLISISARTSASGIFGVITVAIGNSCVFNVSIAVSLISLDPLVATITGSTTIFFRWYSFSFFDIVV